jgi:PAS domain S-box-containing protein
MPSDDSIRQADPDRLQAEARLSTFRNQFDVVLRTLDIPVMVYDCNAVAVFANEAAAKIMGYPDVAGLMNSTRAEIVGRYEFFDASMRPMAPDRTPGYRALHGETIVGERFCFRIRATGVMRWGQINLTPLFAADGTVDMVVLVLQDITEARRAEDSVAKHVKYLEGLNHVSSAMERAPEVDRALPAAMIEILEVFDCDRAWLVCAHENDDGTFRVPFSADRPGTPVAPVPGPNGILPLESGFEAVSLACRSTDEPLLFGGEHSLPNPDFWRNVLGAGRLKAITVRPQIGQPWILCLLRVPGAPPWISEDFRLFKDVASRISAALGAMLLHRDMRRSEEKYRTLFERSLDGIFRCASDGVLLDANPALVAMLGYEDRGQLVGSLQPRLLPAGGDMPGSSDGGETFAVVLPRRDGTPIWLEVNAQPIRRTGGGIAYFEGIVRNINDRKRAEEELKASEDKLRQSQKMEAVGRLAGGVAHDFNNLLTAINGFSDLLLLSFPKDDVRRNHLEEIRKAGSRAAALTSQLLSFSRKQVLSPKVLDVNTVVAGMETMLRRLIGENIEFGTRLEPSLPKVVADPNQLEQVILNLILNARDAMPGGGELRMITASRTLTEGSRTGAQIEVPPGEYVMLSVVDTGTGMDAETKSRLFEPFFTTKQKDKGTGLGLSTVYGAVKQANGTITVESEPERGTIFSIYLPATSRADKPEKARLRERALRTMGGSETILLVEDEDAVRRLVRDVLEVGGYKVLEAPGGEQALELVERQAKDFRIHLLLTDIVMGGISGRVLAEKLRATRPDTKVLFMSGYTEDAIIRHGVYTAQASFIGKPFSPAAISAKVREVLDAQSGKDAPAAGGKEAAAA